MATRVRDSATVDYYAVLGVAADATGDEITRAFRTCAKELHPDAAGAAGAAERFKDVAAAYTVLGDRRARRDYDRRRAEIAVRAAAREPEPTSAPRRVRWTRRRAWTVLVAGIVTTVLGLAAGVWTWRLHERDAHERARFVAVTATRVDVDGKSLVAFETRDGRHVEVAEPHHHGDPQATGATVGVRYDPEDPTRVVSDSSTFGRDITLAIVALKLLVGGPVFAVLGARRLRATRS